MPDYKPGDLITPLSRSEEFPTPPTSGLVSLAYVTTLVGMLGLITFVRFAFG